MNSDVTGRDETKIDITDEMIDAGALALAQYSDGFESLEEAAQRIFRSMVEARKLSAAAL